MSSTTTVTTFLDLYTALAKDVRTDTGQATVVEKTKRYIDEGHQWIYIGHGEKLHWAERRAFVKTHAEYTTGTLTATQGSGTLTGSGTAWATNNGHGQPNTRAGGKLTIEGGNVVYQVLTVPGDTSMTITPEYIGETAAGLSFRYFEDEYALASDFRKPMDMRSFDDGKTIRLIGRTDFRKLFPRNWITSTHVRCAIIQDHAPVGNTTPIRKVRFGPPPSTTIIIPYSYVTRNIVTSSAGVAQVSFSADSDEPTMPLEYRPLILMAAKAAWYRDMKDDARAAAVIQEFVARLDQMIGDQDIGAQKLRIRSNVQSYRNRARGPYRRAGSRYDINGRFDRFEED